MDKLKPLWLLPQKKKIPKFLDTIRVAHVGSQVTMVPPPTEDTDDDYLIFTLKMGYGPAMRDAGWKLGGSEIEGDTFNSWTKDGINLIITDDTTFFDKFILATQVCRALNLKYKPDRIVLFQAILYGNAP